MIFYEVIVKAPPDGELFYARCWDTQIGAVLALAAAAIANMPARSRGGAVPVHFEVRVRT